MAIAGHIAFLPWATLPEPTRVGAFRFVPIHIADLGTVLPSPIVEPASAALRTHVNQEGKPIEKCTLILRVRHPIAWDINPKVWRAAWRASQILAIGCLAEQRFLEGHFAPHMNASMFRPEALHISEGFSGISLTYARRGGGLNVGGRRLSETVFQQPTQIEGTECGKPNLRLVKALEQARRTKTEVWERISDSWEYFLLGHSEVPELDWDSCAMLSAIAFERLLRPSEANAQGIAKAFVKHWKAGEIIAVANAKRVLPDHKLQWQAAQNSWPLHRKWMKELYELRSAKVHRGMRTELTSNWRPWQHVVIAAFTFAQSVKLVLVDAGLYTLSEEEQVHCDKLDALLDSDWGHGWKKPPEWPSILSEEKALRAIRRIVEASLAKTAQTAPQ